jgi:UDP-N-acetylglucosamine acyltransferase
MSEIHPTAIIGKNVEIGVGNTIGPHVIIENQVKIGSHNIIRAGAYLCSGSEIGSHNEIHMGALIGHTPQDTAYKGEPTFTRIGNSNQIREYVTIHRGTKPETATVIGDNNFLMAYCHIAHNCIVGNKVILVNQASLTGYCEVEDGAFLSGMTGLHQFTRVGRLAILSALSAVNKDIPPYMLCGGRPAVVLGVNVVGLRRAGMTAAVREEIKQAYKWLYRSGMNVTQAIEAMKKTLKSDEVQYLIHFIENSTRGICDGAGSEETLKPRKT